eukprot:1185655-Prorocentrum_minimum.AAC.2
MEARRLRCRLGGGHFKTESVKARCSRYLQSTLRPVAMCVTRDENLSYGLNATEAISSRQAISSNEVSESSDAQVGKFSTLSCGTWLATG